MPHVLILVLTLSFLAGCATGPRYETAGVATDLVPAEVVASPGVYRDSRVIWGGMIVATRNLAEYTEMEVLGYPLEGSQRPATNRSPHGRFLVRKPGYLEEMDYAQGRHITVTGTLGENVDGRVGEAPYVYPVVHATELHLWPEARRAPPGQPRFHIGVGVIFGR
ncbi:Slp family lipoprotein [Thioalkalivibrio thiocyanodenitrificans]|uniref:Slp family lipoprotein n=1 Tax=Thioalkalivibrio thiocyanodenitrificans TaxID=243063 RepID=UPI00037B662B|nr:Slp family lipoprotein [Thioalkalivibrio thiocyanodenitrificans]